MAITRSQSPSVGTDARRTSARLKKKRKAGTTDKAEENRPVKKPRTAEKATKASAARKTRASLPVEPPAREDEGMLDSITVFVPGYSENVPAVEPTDASRTSPDRESRPALPALPQHAGDTPTLAAGLSLPKGPLNRVAQEANRPAFKPNNYKDSTPANPSPLSAVHFPPEDSDLPPLPGANPEGNAAQGNTVPGIAPTAAAQPISENKKLRQKAAELITETEGMNPSAMKIDRSTDKAHGKTITENQVTQGYSNGVNEVTTTKIIKELTLVTAKVETHYEFPGVSDLAERIEWAKKDEKTGRFQMKEQGKPPAEVKANGSRIKKREG